MDLTGVPLERVTPDEEMRRLVAGGRLPGVDVEDAMQRLGLERESILRMLRQFATGQSRIVRELRAAIEAGDREEGRRLAHSLAGAAGNLSAHALRRHAKTIELAIKFNQENLEGMLIEVEEEASRVFAGIRLLDEVPSEPAPEQVVVTTGDGSSRKLRDALQSLAGNLELGDLDAIQQGMEALQKLGLPRELAPDGRRLGELVAGFDHVQASELARRMAADLRWNDRLR
jgi:HPt (histidine-containing phosphotransfer) domain-containing protein